MNTTYGDISPRTAAYVVKDLLKRGFPYLVFEKFGQAKPLPKNSTKTIKFRRYFLKHSSMTTFTPSDYFDTANFDPIQKQLSEGVTPDATQLDKQDIDATLVQYGDRTVITDVVMDTHEDPVLREATEILGEQAAIILEKSRFNVLKDNRSLFTQDLRVFRRSFFHGCKSPSISGAVSKGDLCLHHLSTCIEEA